MEYFKQIQSHLQNHNLPAIIKLWEEYCLSDEIELEELVAILKLLKKTPYSDAFGRYVDQILPLWESSPEGPLKHEAFLFITDIEPNQSQSMVERILKYIQERYQDQHDIAAKIKIVTTKEEGNLQGAVRNFELLQHFKKGNFVYHDAGWGVGEIMDVSFIREEISLEFENVVGRRDLSFKNAFKTLIPLSSDHFLAMRFGNPDELEKRGRQDSVEVIKKLLKDLGPKTAQEIKDELCDLIIPEEEWAKWWSAARSRLKKDTMIQAPDSIKQPFILRKEEVSHETRLIRELKEHHLPKTVILSCYEIVRDFPSALKNRELKEQFKAKIKESLNASSLSTEEKLELSFLLQDVEPDSVNSQELINSIESIGSSLQKMTVLSFKKRLLQNLQTLRKDWIDLYLDLLLTLDQNPLREFVFQELIKSGKTDAIKEKLETLLKDPHEYAQAFLWYFQKLIDKGKIPFSDQEGKSRFLESLFALLYVLEQYPNERDQVKKCLSILTNGRYAVIRSIFQEAPKAVVQEILLLASKCQSFTEHDRKILQSLAEVVHPSLAKLQSSSDFKEEEEEMIWSTEEGYFKLKDKIHHIATFETVDNAKEIEVARSHGDLRENSEYKFALERRDRLQSELKLLSDMLNKMRILTAEDVDTSRVSVGCVVTLKSKSNQTESYTLLGPMDSDADRGILSFQSKLAQSLKGKKLGERVQLHQQEWVINQIKSYF